MRPNDEQLKKLALAATQGKWEVELLGHALRVVVNSDGEFGDDVLVIGNVFVERRRSDAEYIARANPTTVLDLLHRLEVAERALDLAALPQAFGKGDVPRVVKLILAQAERELEGKR